MMTRNERDAIIQHGTMTLVRQTTLAAVGGWAEWCITEDAELGLRILEHGQSALYIPRSYGRGLVPDNFLDYKRQRFRWAYGAVRILAEHLGQLLGTRASALTTGQRYHFVAGWLPWLTDGFNLLITVVAIAWTTAMVLMPERVAPPHPPFVVLPMALFGFKLAKLLSLYRWRVRAGWRESLAAGIAGLALSHVVARAVLTSLVDHSVGFFRTPKQSSKRGWLRAFADAREEIVLLTALLLGAVAVLGRDDGQLIDVRLWSTLLVMQATPYAASVLLSFLSATPRLPSHLVSNRGTYRHPARNGERQSQ
jgi:hypothetical protein